MENNLNSSLETLFGKMDNFISTKTVVGEPINIGGTIMLPLVDVTFGVGAGAVNGKDKDIKNTDAGALGARITPSAVIVIKDNTVQLVNVKNQDAVSKLIDMAPGIVSKFNLGSIFNSKDTSDRNKPINSEKLPEEKIITETVVREVEE